MMGPDPQEWAERSGSPHVGTFLRRQRTYAKIGAEQLAQADGTWDAGDVVSLEQQRTIGPEDWTRYRRALEMAKRYLRENQP